MLFSRYASGGSLLFSPAALCSFSACVMNTIPPCVMDSRASLRACNYIFLLREAHSRSDESSKLSIAACNMWINFCSSVWLLRALLMRFAVIRIYFSPRLRLFHRYVRGQPTLFLYTMKKKIKNNILCMILCDSWYDRELLTISSSPRVAAVRAAFLSFAGIPL